MFNLFEELKKYVDEMRATNSSNAKVDIIKRYPHLKQLFEYVYSPFKKFYVTPKQLDKHSDLFTDCAYLELFELLDDLTNRKITGHRAIKEVNGFIKAEKKHEELIRLIIGKDLKTRAGASLINKAFKSKGVPDVVPTFKLALANGYDEKRSPKKMKISINEWYESRKLDGVRNLAFVDIHSDTTHLSRSGKEFLTFDKVTEEIKRLGLTDMILDGEMCVVDENGNEDFTAIVSQIRRKNHTVEKPKYLIFDCLTHEEFEKREGTVNVINRRKRLEGLIDGSEILELLEFTKINTHAEIKYLSEIAVEKGWEGLILRHNTGYKGKRSNDLLKVKLFKEEEYVVEDVVGGPWRAIENGLEVTIETLLSVWIKHKGRDVSVGSGFSLDQRKYYYQHPEEIVGKEITVKYFEETETDEGFSLRFGTVKHIWKDGKRDI